MNIMASDNIYVKWKYYHFIITLPRYICFYNLSLVSWHGTRHYYVNKFMAIISGSSHIARFAISFRPTFPSYLEWFLSWQKWLVFVFFETIHVFLMLSCQFSVKGLIIIIQEGNFVSF